MGVKAVIAEAGGAGRLEESANSAACGLASATRCGTLAMLPGEPDPPRSRTVGEFVWLRPQRPAGFWVAHVRTGERGCARRGGEVRDLDGDVIQTLRAPADGVVLFLTTSAAVTENGLLLGLGTQLS